MNTINSLKKRLSKTALPCLPLLIAVLPSCAPMSNENAKPAGAAVGTLLGAAAGGIVGHQSGRGGEGALAGAAAGGISGWGNGTRWFGGDGSIQKTRVEN